MTKPILLHSTTCTSENFISPVSLPLRCNDCSFKNLRVKIEKVYPGKQRSIAIELIVVFEITICHCTLIAGR
jgi:hypothetical protein